MRAVVQRVSGASVVVDGETVGEIRGRGLCVLVGVTHDDTKEKAERLARKLWTVRLFDGDGDADGDGGGEGGAAGPGSEKSCSDLGAPLMVISQFTLYGDARKGRRPTWNAAAPGELAEPLVDEVVARLRSLGARVETGRFGADMKVSLTNDGPFTVLLEV
ncbi:D-aminoacyl-tRNA deacylase [Streptomyces xinghaiensis]|uniref:D-aminoacyl-tRNA deacylase n=1 Tax=Streptomyces xinghaiensis TaxID=1038928 RepID=UPI0005848BB7|nr:D-aminoacyl-tRNA deacylase [Streptomyces xinghaiensis]MZE79755.1 D-tyrosyl-tRNA(Tyr) deacylase [Streptomyces sp. SID5475]